MNNPFFANGPTFDKGNTSKSSNKLAKYNELEGSLSCFESEFQCGMFYIRNWAVGIWALCILAMVTTILAIYFGVQNAQAQTQLQDAYGLYQAVVYGYHTLESCTLGADISHTSSLYDLRTCTHGASSHILNSYVISLKTSTSTNAKYDNTLFFADIVSSGPAYNLVYNGVPRALMHQLRITNADKKHVSWDSTYMNMQHGESSIFQDTWFSNVYEWIIVPFRHVVSDHSDHSKPKSNMIDHLYSVSMLHNDGTTSQTIVKQVGNVLHLGNREPKVAAAMHDLGIIISRLLPSEVTAYTTGLQLNQHILSSSTQDTASANVDYTYLNLQQPPGDVVTLQSGVFSDSLFVSTTQRPPHTHVHSCSAQHVCHQPGLVQMVGTTIGFYTGLEAIFINTRSNAATNTYNNVRVE